jgi:hypothetical protein
MKAFLGVVVAITASLWWRIARSVNASIARMREPEARLRQAVEEPGGDFAALIEATDAWARAHGLTKDGVLEFFTLSAGNPLRVCTWRDDDAGMFLGLYYARIPLRGRVVQRTLRDLVTFYGEERSVTTSDSRDGVLLPRAAGAYAQAFPGARLDALYAEHQAACRLLEEKTGARAQPLRADTRDIMLWAIRRQLAHVTSLPLWYLRGAHWYLVRRRLLAGKPLRSQGLL